MPEGGLHAPHLQTPSPAFPCSTVPSFQQCSSQQGDHVYTPCYQGQSVHELSIPVSVLRAPPLTQKCSGLNDKKLYIFKAHHHLGPFPLMFTSIWVCSMAAVIQKLGYLGFGCYDKQTIEKRCRAIFCHLQRSRRDSEVYPANRIALKVQFLDLQVSSFQLRTPLFFIMRVFKRSYPGEPDFFPPGRLRVSFGT